MRSINLSCVLCFWGLLCPGQAQQIPAGYESDPFRQLEEILPSPSVYRAASGAPGERYWQQRVDYDIQVALDEKQHHLTGEETIIYHNHSPHTLPYLWVQLDQNRFRKHSEDYQARPAPDFSEFSFDHLGEWLRREDFEGGFKIESVTLADGSPLPHAIVGTMMRLDLPEPLAPERHASFRIKWRHPIVDAKTVRARGGYEWFPEDKNALYEMAQWFPRMASYTDVNGWQHKQFLGKGEFTLEFGDYRVAITAPADHLVTASGVLQNPEDVLTPLQRERLDAARSAKTPQFIVTPEEARENEKSKSTETKTWVFKAENVRDFAWASSRKFIWDALLRESHGREVWCMSFYPKEGEPLWGKYSTHAIAHTIDVYSKFTFPYPYPVAISVNGPVGGMEYPMICFNGPRPEKDGTYPERTKYGLISVIIHEVGHNWFPMIVNSDERQWTWMDEGLNTLLQTLAEREWEEDYPSRRGKPKDLVGFMTSENQVPIMTNSESLLQFGANAYGKPAIALTVLRETILGRELFDFAFQQYARRWMFKRPQPADFFRSMEDASSIDLDWFWRGWFYTTDHVDIGIAQVRLFDLDTRDPEIEKPKAKAKEDAEPEDLTIARNKDLQKRVERFPELLDFYNTFDEHAVTEKDREAFQKYLEDLEDEEKALLKTPWYFYAIDFENIGRLVMPLILEITYEDGRNETLRIPAEIWRHSPRRTSKLLLATSKIERLVLDPHHETADAEMDNNYWPARPVESRFQLFKRKKELNPMQEVRQGEDRGNAQDAAEPNKEEVKSQNDES